ncbi:4'-phosphopantetheinyl transferase superfamily protein [Micromonospora sp. AMSO1212t]|uniref:4'-phosphopantetheinyl transferase family protein n=1 Tax=Micromonospora sp. AMSO1212t TaxID=2650565 RepID=UPI00124B7D2C|nr:4'-phosphopantetheinyl transferase superfamily protein [Micromonospora sp. AMSO1212t]KAB1910339.1 4'-phosphopantetheinyl transferase superfamily protein [Micromonospora sp. AMSO1212t]
MRSARLERTPMIAGPDDTDACTVWVADVAAERPFHSDLLDPDERGRRAALRRPADQARFTMAAAMIRLVAAGLTGTPPATIAVDRRCPGCGRAHGKPRLPGTGLEVSVSHSADRVLLAVTRAGPVGVDVERITDADTSTLAGRVLAPGEPVRRPRDFFVYWCRKESAVKATGDGLRVPLSEVVVRPADAPAGLLSYRGSRLTAAMADLDVGPGYAAAVTVLTGRPVRVWLRDAGTALAE